MVEEAQQDSRRIAKRASRPGTFIVVLNKNRVLLRTSAWPTRAVPRAYRERRSSTIACCRSRKHAIESRAALQLSITIHYIVC
jgi:hypothetical protein